MEVIDLLLHVNAAIVLITFVFLHRLGSLLILLLDLVENFLQLIQVETAPSLKL